MKERTSQVIKTLDLIKALLQTASRESTKASNMTNVGKHALLLEELSRALVKSEMACDKVQLKVLQDYRTMEKGKPKEKLPGFRLPELPRADEDSVGVYEMRLQVVGKSGQVLRVVGHSEWITPPVFYRFDSSDNPLKDYEECDLSTGVQNEEKETQA